ncbi:MAG: hypothetical protein KIS84_13390 [Dokdonella sp.]|nr:hypothetical protein [Dokdonella sp.]
MPILSEAKVNEVKRYLAAGWSARKVAARCNVSRGSVQAIANGRWACRMKAKREAREALEEPVSYEDIRQRAFAERHRKLAAKRASLTQKGR